MENLDGSDEMEGVRERKRRETRQRIVDAGLKLFAAKGYEASTLDDIAAEAGISRRTFFHYFKSKDEILLSLQSGLGEALSDAARDCSSEEEPLAAMKTRMLEISRRYPAAELLVIDRMMRSSEVVQARKRASYIADESVVFAAMRDVWPERAEMDLRILAMLCISVTRLSLDAWSREGGTRELAEVAEETFVALGAVVSA
ncbi:hypothetical protein ASG47_01495 [Devosia sp. Leaf420]|uniref:TetR/AcrR family transcriptional regulator n=1 Tax=Devosia sp. Leaf420 TaxID=1736374 RepID=UPI000714BBCA|nr:TetR/AcrR family transcriptional regulator [Devosia sp. Leaf420]KQT51592.1 hypothetical protein ASG47_01495 [Devosia sp. Leaf420]